MRRVLWGEVTSLHVTLRLNDPEKRPQSRAEVRQLRLPPKNLAAVHLIQEIIPEDCRTTSLVIILSPEPGIVDGVRWWLTARWRCRAVAACQQSATALQSPTPRRGSLIRLPRSSHSARRKFLRTTSLSRCTNLNAVERLAVAAMDGHGFQ